MNQDFSDPTLAQLFERQRALDLSATPPFARLSRVARPAPRRSRRPTWAAVLAAAAVPAVAVVVFRLQAPRPATELPTPVRSAAIAIAAWEAPTDALLPNYAATSFAALTPPGGSWTDELLPSSRNAAAQ